MFLKQKPLAFPKKVVDALPVAQCKTSICNEQGQGIFYSIDEFEVGQPTLSSFCEAENECSPSKPRPTWIVLLLLGDAMLCYVTIQILTWQILGSSQKKLF